MPAPPDDPTPPTLAEILAACLAVQAIYAARDAAAAAQDGPPARQASAGAAIDDAGKGGQLARDEYNLPYRG
jgi:cell pole-organizing protein PopZ